jgi:hypothetical protein
MKAFLEFILRNSLRRAGVELGRPGCDIFTVNPEVSDFNAASRQDCQFGSLGF